MITCQDCGLDITEDEAEASDDLALNLKQLEATGRCIGCEFTYYLNLKGEIDARRKANNGTPAPAQPALFN